jgi:hypothetical protein
MQPVLKQQQSAKVAAGNGACAAASTAGRKSSVRFDEAELQGVDERQH